MAPGARAIGPGGRTKEQHPTQKGPRAATCGPEACVVVFRSVRRAVRSRFCEGVEFAQHLLVLGEPTDLILGEDQFSVGGDIEDAAAAFDELGLDAVGLLDGLRQTGGFGEVVSLHAVLDADLHAHRPPVWRFASHYSGRGPSFHTPLAQVAPADMIVRQGRAAR